MCSLYFLLLEPLNLNKNIAVAKILTNDNVIQYIEKNCYTDFSAQKTSFSLRTVMCQHAFFAFIKCQSNICNDFWVTRVKVHGCLKLEQEFFSLKKEIIQKILYQYSIDLSLTELGLTRSETMTHVTTDTHVQASTVAFHIEWALDTKISSIICKIYWTTSIMILFICFLVGFLGLTQCILAISRG